MPQLLQTTDFRSPCPLPRSVATYDSPMSSEDSLEPSTTCVPISNIARAAAFEHHKGHWRPSSALPSDSAPAALTSTIIPTSTVNYVSSISTPTLLTTLPAENIVPFLTAVNDPSTSTRALAVILGVVLGVAGVVALGVIILCCHARKRSKSLPNALSSDFKMSQGRRNPDLTVAIIPQVNPAMLGRQITSSYQISSTPTPERVTSCISKPGEFSPSSGRHLSDPFADSHQDMVSSRMSMPSIYSQSITMVFAPSDNSHTQEGGLGGEDMQKSVDGSTSSLELRFVPPLVFSDDSPTRSLHLSSTGHYEGISPTSSPTENGFWNEEGQSKTPPTASPPSRPFYLDAEGARMRLHELLMEARRPWTEEQIVS